ncbi:hypothetical protein [Escherichia phage NTNC80A]|uniref:Uncharacterized protein n=1 Tax=Escherichia phage NTNC80A TaxID=2970325 RepID=A0A976SPL8_9CAUD|nr:hypothetical protein [Escherichia phage NTNC80A]
MPTIEERLKLEYHYFYAPLRKTEVTVVKVKLDGDLFLQKVKETRSQNESRTFAYEVLYSVLKEWPTCDQTSTSEPQYRKTIISSCGQLKVIESL